jgi:hypothetical protein
MSTKSVEYWLLRFPALAKFHVAPHQGLEAENSEPRISARMTASDAVDGSPPSCGMLAGQS